MFRGNWIIKLCPSDRNRCTTRISWDLDNSCEFGLGKQQRDLQDSDALKSVDSMPRQEISHRGLPSMDDKIWFYGAILSDNSTMSLSKNDLSLGGSACSVLSGLRLGGLACSTLSSKAMQTEPWQDNIYFLRGADGKYGKCLRVSFSVRKESVQEVCRGLREVRTQPFGRDGSWWG